MHVEALLREGRRHLGKTSITGDRMGGDGVEHAEGREQGQAGSSKEGEVHQGQRRRGHIGKGRRDKEKRRTR